MYKQLFRYIFVCKYLYKIFDKILFEYVSVGHVQ